MRGTLKLMSLRLINEKTPLLNLVRFAHNWNIGFWETAAVVYWQNPIDKEVNKMRNFHVRSSFQYSLAQTPGPDLACQDAVMRRQLDIHIPSRQGRLACKA